MKSGGYKIFLDDLRSVEMVYGPKNDIDFEVVRNVEDFKSLVEKKGIPNYVSFDHDLGLDSDGNTVDAYEVVKWMVFEMEYDLREMQFFIHSANPLAYDRIASLIKNWNKELYKRDEQKNKE